MPITIDGNLGVTYPDVTTQNTSAVIGGKLPTARLPAGSVLQVVTATTTNQTAVTTASTWTTTGFSVSITPTSSSSKILVMIIGGMFDNASDARQGAATIYRGATNLGDSTRGLMQFYANGARMQVGSSLGVYDSPATTSSTTYTLYLRSNNGNGDTIYFNTDPCFATIVAMEIAA